MKTEFKILLIWNERIYTVYSDRENLKAVWCLETATKCRLTNLYLHKRLFYRCISVKRKQKNRNEKRISNFSLITSKKNTTQSKQFVLVTMYHDKLKSELLNLHIEENFPWRIYNLRNAIEINTHCMHI